MPDLTKYWLVGLLLFITACKSSPKEKIIIPATGIQLQVEKLFDYDRQFEFVEYACMTPPVRIGNYSRGLNCAFDSMPRFATIANECLSSEYELFSVLHLSYLPAFYERNDSIKLQEKVQSMMAVNSQLGLEKAELIELPSGQKGFLTLVAYPNEQKVMDRYVLSVELKCDSRFIELRYTVKAHDALQRSLEIYNKLLAADLRSLN